MHLSDWPKKQLEFTEQERDAWQELLKLRELALPELEKARQAKLIGKALEAKLIFTGAVSLSDSDREALRELLNVSQLEVKSGAGELAITVSKADGYKCERCWHWETDVGATPTYPGICGRCVAAVKEVTGS